MEQVGQNHLASAIIAGLSDFSASQLSQLNEFGNVNTIIGNIATIQLPRMHIWHVARLDFVARVDGGYAVPKLDVSVPEIKANMVWETFKDSQGRRIDGSGVIIGIVDSGIDWKHSDFKFENRSSKILYLWDQTTTGMPPAGYSYGTEWTRTRIEAEACTETDTEGHGTHVAGIAAGTGAARGRYVGVAPGAALVVVKSGKLTKKGWIYSLAEVLDGVNYIWRKALALGKRAIINLSLGSHSGGHDGTTAFEKGLDRLASEGAIVVTAAGNEGAKKIHVEGRLRQGESINLGFKVDKDEDEFQLETWFSRSDAFDLSLRTPSGQKVNGPTVRGGASTSEGRVYILEDSTEKGKAWVVSVSSSKALPREGWAITLTGKSIMSEEAWDAWIATGGEFAAGSGYEITNRKTISIPGTAHNTITVGAYVTRMFWKGKDGKIWRYPTAESEGDIATFSSVGPTRDDRLKPDICAPGMGIIAPRSSDAKPRENDPDDLYTIMQGTSMAAPHVTGLLALILQYNERVSPGRAKSILRLTGRRDIQTGKIDPAKGSFIWGYGKPDAKEAVVRSPVIYPVSILVTGIPPSASTRVLIDGVEKGSISGESMMIFGFEDQIAHTLSVQSVVNVSDTIRCVISQNSLKFSSEVSHTFHYATQYYVKVVSQYGSPRGSGWYDAGSRASISVEPRVLSDVSYSILIYRKATYQFFDRWTVQPAGSVSPSPTGATGTVLVDSPKVVTAKWQTETSTELDPVALAILVAASVVVVVVLLIIARRRKVQIGFVPSRQPALYPCPKCGRPLTYIQQYQRWYCYNCKEYA